MEGDEAVSVDTIFDGFEFVSGDVGDSPQSTKETPVEEGSRDEEQSETEEQGGTEGEDSGEPSGQTDEGSPEQGNEEVGSKEEQVDDDPEFRDLEREIKAETPPSKLIKAKKGEKEVDLEEDILIPTKVEGRFEEVPLKTLRESYSSKEHNHRQFRKLEQERRQFSEAREQFDGVITNFAKKAGSGEVVPAVMDLIQATGQDPLPIINNLREGLIEQAAELFQMSKEERMALYKQEGAEYYRKQRDSLLEQQRIQLQQQQLETQIAQTISNYGLPDRETFIEVVPKAEAYLREAKAKGQVAKEVALTPEMVGKYYQAERLRGNFVAIMTEVAPHIKEDTPQWAKFAQWAAQTKPTPDKIRVAAKKLFGSNGQASSTAKQGKPEKPSKPAKKANRLEELASVDPGLDIDATPDLSGIDWR